MAHCSMASARSNIAVLEFSGGSHFSVEQRLYFSDQIRAEANQLIGENYNVITREMMGELAQSESLIEASQEGREIDVGRGLRVKWLISGALSGDTDLTYIALKLHDIKRGVTVDIEFGEASNVSDLELAVRSASARLLIHLIKPLKDTELAELTLPSERLPNSFELSPSDTLGLPIPLLKQYDRALVIDESVDVGIERKLAVWSKLSRYRQYKKLQTEASRRLKYWRRRFKRRVQCNRTWSQLEQILTLKRAITAEKKEELVESFLDACGRTEEENPNLAASYFVNKRLEAARADTKRLEEIAAKERAKQAKNE